MIIIFTTYNIYFFAHEWKRKQQPIFLNKCINVSIMKVYVTGLGMHTSYGQVYLHSVGCFMTSNDLSLLLIS